MDVTIDDGGEEPSVDRAHLSEQARSGAADADIARDAASEQLARLKGDREVFDELRAVDFTGRKWEMFQRALAAYGYAVMRGWIYKGVIRAKLRSKGLPTLASEPYPGALIQDADGVAGETVARALNAYRDKVLRPGRWDPSRGASLLTFFVGQCLMQFGNVYTSWHREQVRNALPKESIDAFEDGDPREPSAPDNAGHAGMVLAELRLTFGKITDERCRTAFYLQAVLGHTHEEIGRKLDMTPKAVESALARARRQAQEGRESA